MHIICVCVCVCVCVYLIYIYLIYYIIDDLHTYTATAEAPWPGGVVQSIEESEIQASRRQASGPISTAGEVSAKPNPYPVTVTSRPPAIHPRH